MKKILLLLFCLFLPLFLFAQAEKEAILLLHNSQYDKAIASFQAILQKDATNPLANFGLAKTYYEKQQSLKKSQPTNTIKYRNLQAHFDLLKQAYICSQKAATNYVKMTATQKDLFKMFSVSETQIQNTFSYTIESEAFNFINTVPYKNSFEQLYVSQVYNKELDADTLLALRDALHDQASDFLLTYKNVTNAKTVTQIRKDLFSEMLNSGTARRYGDKGGKIYEQHCNLILKYYSQEELKTILPIYYGFEYGFSATFSEDEIYKKLQDLATSEKTTILELLCKLNLHYKGCGTENKTLYDKFIRKLAPADVAFVALQRMASSAIQEKKWSEATTIFKTYQSLFVDNRIQKIIDLLNTADDNIALVNLGKTINSPYNDYSPVLAADGTLYFARKSENTGEDVFASSPQVLAKQNLTDSEKLPKTVFDMAMPLTKINTKSHEIPLSVSIDGKTLVLFGNYSGLPEFFYVLKTEKKLGKGDIYYINKKGKDFDKVEVFPAPVNTENYESDLSITPDNKAVLFCSDRKGNVGGYLPNYPDNGLYYHGSGEFNTDIWVAIRNDKDGKMNFDAPINLGAKINTAFAEKKPFLHPDMKTLYFCSEGHYGFGGYDIFMSKRLNDNSWTEWSEPINLGKIINSPFDDSFYISPTGELALIVAEKPANLTNNAIGKLDIYQMTVPQRFRPEPVTTISGIVNDDKGKPIQAKIVWRENSEKDIISSNNFKENTKKINGGDIETDENGNFYFVVPQNKNYIYYAEKDGFFGGGLNITNNTNNISTQNNTNNEIRNPNISQKKDEIANNLQPSKFNLQISTLDKTDKNRKPFVMRSLNFDHNSDVIRKESYFDLYRLAALLLQNPMLKLAIEGHTDNAGTHEFNEDLSQRRAKAVLTFLVKNGVKALNITSKGFGETMAIAENTTEIGKEKNRRVEFRIVE